MKRDVLFLCQFFYPEYVSSATLPFDTAVALEKNGFTVGALCGYPKEYNLEGQVPLKETQEGIQIKRLRYLTFKRSNFIGRLINYFSFTLSVLLSFSHLNKYKAVVVYSNPPILPLVAALANKFYGTKVIFVSYDVYPEIAYVTNTIAKDSLISKLMNRVNKTVFRSVNTVVALSNEMKDYLVQQRPALSEEQVRVIPNWYEDNYDLLQSRINKRFLNKGENTLVVSYFGNLGIAQEFDTVINAIRELKDNSKIQFVFAGHGNKMKVLADLVEEESLSNVKIFNFLHGQDFQDALNISDCFLVSLAEGLTGLAVPSKTYSYMMIGKPVLAIIGEKSDIARDLIDNNAGFVLQPGDVSGLVDAIKALEDNETRKFMGANCRRVFVNKYSKEHCTEKYVDLMTEILEDTRYVQG